MARTDGPRTSDHAARKAGRLRVQDEGLEMVMDGETAATDHPCEGVVNRCD